MTFIEIFHPYTYIVSFTEINETTFKIEERRFQFASKIECNNFVKTIIKKQNIVNIWMDRIYKNRIESIQVKDSNGDIASKNYENQHPGLRR